jgi:hypothetical protein
MIEGTVAAITAQLEAAQDRVNDERNRLFEEIGKLTNALERIRDHKFARIADCTEIFQEIAREALDSLE